MIIILNQIIIRDGICRFLLVGRPVRVLLLGGMGVVVRLGGRHGGVATDR